MESTTTVPVQVAEDADRCLSVLGDVPERFGVRNGDRPLVVSEASCIYRKPIASLALVAVGVRAARIGHASIVLEYAIRTAPDGPLHATGSTTIVCVDPVSGRPRGLPPWTVAALRQLELGEQGYPPAAEGGRQ